MILLFLHFNDFVRFELFCWSHTVWRAETNCSVKQGKRDLLLFLSVWKTFYGLYSVLLLSTFSSVVVFFPSGFSSFYFMLALLERPLLFILSSARILALVFLLFLLIFVIFSFLLWAFLLTLFLFVLLLVLLFLLMFLIFPHLLLLLLLIVTFFCCCLHCFYLFPAVYLSCAVVSNVSTYVWLCCFYYFYLYFILFLLIVLFFL